MDGWKKKGNCDEPEENSFHYSALAFALACFFAYLLPDAYSLLTLTYHVNGVWVSPAVELSSRYELLIIAHVPELIAASSNVVCYHLNLNRSTKTIAAHARLLDVMLMTFDYFAFQIQLHTTNPGRRFFFLSLTHQPNKMHSSTCAPRSLLRLMENNVKL